MDTITGTAGNDSLPGTIGDNSILGEAGNDTLEGLAGFDVLDGGLGDDSLIGGLGNDTYGVDSEGDVVVENEDEGTDLVSTSLTTYTLGANLENLWLLSGGTGTGNELDNQMSNGDPLNSGAEVTLSGLAGADTLQGGTGDDSLNGGDGADQMTGGDGDDSYVVDTLLDQVTESTDEGHDSVDSSISFTLSDNVEDLTLATAAAGTGTGNDLDNSITGTAFANTLSGLGGADTLLGGAGLDSLEGGDGNDQLNGGTGDDNMAGGDGDDLYQVDTSGDTVVEAEDEGHDTVYSSASLTLPSNVEDLTLLAGLAFTGTGNDLGNIITGNTNAEVLSGQGGADTLYGLADNDNLDGGSGGDSLSGGDGNDLVHGADDDDSIDGGAGADTLYGDLGDDSLSGGDDNDSLIGGDGDDTASGGGGADVIYGGYGDDSLAGGDGADVMDGHFGDNTLEGGAGNDSLSAFTGEDRLDGGAGDDTMEGGSGADLYIVDSADDVIQNENFFFDHDTVRSSAASYTLAGGIEDLELTGSDSIGGTGSDGANRITGNSAANHLDGGDGNDTLLGMAGGDSLEGGSQDDSLDGGTGDDTMAGGLGADQYLVDSGDDVVEEDADEGQDNVYSSASYTLSDNVEDLVLQGNSGLAGYGNSLGNQITGNAYGNWLDGGGGDDSLAGGEGDDTYVVDSALDQVYEAADEGDDTVEASSSYALGDNVEDLVLTGSGGNSGTGNSLANHITGNDGGNVLDGGAGDDTLTGGAGDDSYYVDSEDDVVVESGTAGNDQVFVTSGGFTLAANVENGTLTFDGTGVALTGNALANSLLGNQFNNQLDGAGGDDAMIGGFGDDTYGVDSAGDAITEGFEEGTDEVRSSISYTLSDPNLENLTLLGTAAINGTGNDAGNEIDGNSGANSLDGAGGNDSLYGFNGNDTLQGGAGADFLAGGRGQDAYFLDSGDDSISEGAGGGKDTVLASFSYTLGANLENLTLTGSDLVAGGGNSVKNVLTGNGASNWLSGYGNNDTLKGNAGEDTLDGGTGADSMIGGTGSDYFYVDNAGDVVTDSGAGNDTVQSSVTFTLGANLENLKLTGSGDVSGTGNELANLIVSNHGDNSLDGTAGQDTVSYEFATRKVTVNLVTGAASGDGADTLAGFEHVIGSSFNDTLIGGAGGNRLTGLLGNDSLDGGAGADTMAGGDGNDTYVVNAAGDVVTENMFEGTDTVRSSVSFTLGANLEALVLTGNASINGTGNQLDNSLTGTAGANVLDGMQGSDTMAGGTGNDTYYVVNGLEMLPDSSIVFSLDSVVEEVAGGHDTVYIGSFLGIGEGGGAYELAANVEDLVLIGDAFTGLGNELANLMTGNEDINGSSLFGAAGNDTLVGHLGGDTLGGGLGDDSMVGGDGDDAYEVDSAGDVIVEAANEGLDRVESSITYALSAALEDLTLAGSDAIDGTGNAGDNDLRGNSNDNLLSGGEGNDTLIGNSGNDTLVGGNGNDFLRSGAGADSLDGGVGNDTLNGENGSPTLVGGAGNDSYVVDSRSDLIVELAGGGTDTVFSFSSYRLGGNVENLIVAQGSGTGNSLANVISTQPLEPDGGTASYILSGLGGDDTLVGLGGNDALLGGGGADSLDGGTGNDTMAGGAGNDVYSLGESGDVVVENTGQGIDTVQAFISYSLGANLENLTLIGSAVFGMGNDLANSILGTNGDNLLLGGLGNDSVAGAGGEDVLDGGDGNDELDGGNGGDVMIGGAGNDIYYVENVEDVTAEDPGDGIDSVVALVGWTLDTDVENLVLNGLAVIDGFGNDLGNSITGNSKANRLDGGDGNDVLTGNAGADAFVFSSAVTAANADTIADFAHGFDHIDLDHAVFTTLALGALPAGELVKGASVGASSATQADDHLLYNTTNGNLYYDVDGAGGVAGTLIFTLATHPTTLSAADIHVI